MDTTPAVTYITPDEAKAIALQDAGLEASDIRDLEVELDLDDGPAHYDVDFEKTSADYEYDIDAVTGQILRAEKPSSVQDQTGFLKLWCFLVSTFP